MTLGRFEGTCIFAINDRETGSVTQVITGLTTCRTRLQSMPWRVRQEWGPHNLIPNP
jgi:hypothetical protein